MAKLYELLAVEKDLQKEAESSLKGTAALFNQPDKLTGKVFSSHTILEGEPDIPEEVTQLAYTVEGELKKLEKVFGDYLNVTIQKEASNTITSSSILIGENALLDNLPATALLNLEARLEELKKVYEAIPTLDPSERWTWDAGQGCYISATRKSYRTKKVLRNHVLAEATKEHPAQVQVYQEDIPAYEVEKVIQSGMLTPADKQERLARITKVAAAVKKARQRANDVDASLIEVSKKIFDYINNGDL